MAYTLKTFVALSLLLVSASVALAQPKIAVVDMKKVFDGYWKTKQLEKKLKGSEQEFKDQRKKMIEQFQAAQKEYLAIKESAKDPALSANEKERRNTESEEKLQQMRQLENDINSHERSGVARLNEQQLRHKNNLITDIKDTIKVKARSEGFSLVLNTAAVDINQAPIVLFTDGANDITDDILATLNQGK